jgi:hypothetical protein
VQQVEEYVWAVWRLPQRVWQAATSQHCCWLMQLLAAHVTKRACRKQKARGGFE